MVDDRWLRPAGASCFLNLESGMSTGPHDDCPSRERLSALADGETGGTASAAACTTWRDDADARRDWHAWQLIGDVLRSDELASDGARDARFLAAVRERLAAEPVVMAPMPMAASIAARRGGRWMLPASMAAGFVLVVGAFAVVRPDVSAPAADTAVARTESSSPSTADSTFVPVDLRETARGSGVIVADQKMIRDAQLERYLAAHKQFAGTTALGVPSAFLRSATVESASR
jgi:sigma-E factor negative regulatory protein RseA